MAPTAVNGSTALMLRKLSSYPRQNGLAVALREIGQIERTLFTLDWLQDVELRPRVNAAQQRRGQKRLGARRLFQLPRRGPRSQL
jgi:TnpA family transposase